ncbi:MAG: sigma-70 family RNA polymerase sigma factor [Planctomycetaceae bacterium]|nr:sigma-70 family RNA polymerase sigma factor [Planctomycetales bacterium]MCB9926977.1 sigma-70 family RNA polymerase sigma factor [Planctomycetaceae bacterium]
MERIDSQSLQTLIDSHGAALKLYARQWCHTPDDALQEALIELLRQHPAPDHPAAWLFTTIRRRAMSGTSKRAFRFRP